MKLILKVIDSDGCTYSADVYMGVEADGKDELGLLILDAIEQQCGHRIREAEELERSQTLTPEKRRERIDRGPFPAVIEIGGTLVKVESDFSPEHDIMTLDEFFEREAVETTKHRADEAKSTKEWLESRGKR